MAEVVTQLVALVRGVNNANHDRARARTAIASRKTIETGGTLGKSDAVWHQIGSTRTRASSTPDRNAVTHHDNQVAFDEFNA
jgi:hypothetical protein